MTNYIHIREGFLNFGKKKNIEAKNFISRLEKVRNLKTEDFTILFQAFEDSYGKMKVEFRIGSFDHYQAEPIVELCDLSYIDRFHKIITWLLDKDNIVDVAINTSTISFYKKSIEEVDPKHLQLGILFYLSFDKGVMIEESDVKHCCEIAKDYYNIDLFSDVTYDKPNTNIEFSIFL